MEDITRNMQQCDLGVESHCNVLVLRFGLPVGSHDKAAGLHND